jgi:Ca2+-binding RTX toxin-like protein
MPFGKTAGDDNLNGGTGKDILIGGIGADLLTGGSGENLLLGARYTSEANATALIALRSEWTSASSYADRVAHLRGTLAGGLNGSYKLTSATVKEDNAKDTLKGSSGKDWYLRNRLGATVANRDAVTDVDLDSVFTEISSWL